MLTTLALWTACSSTPTAPEGGGNFRGHLRQREAAPASDPAPAPAPAAKVHPTDTNILLVVLDDVGVDKVAAYGLAESAPPTPTLSRLAEEGRVFRRAWVNPMCSPTRAAIMTGRHGRRTGIGMIVDSWKEEPDLAEAEISIPEVLDRSGKSWSTSFVGKWHLSSKLGPGVLKAPARQGFDWYRFVPGNLREPFGGRDDEKRSYARWLEVDNGETKEQEGYILRHQADDAIARMKEMPEPWFLWTAFTGVHVPLAPPPAEYGARVPSDPTDADLYDATLRALDHELGRVVGSLSAEQRARTTIIVVGDNGTPDHAIRAPFDPREGKGSLMELGVRVPLIVTGPLVEKAGPTDALVHGVDIFATIADVAGVDVSSLGTPIDGVSFYDALKRPDAPGPRTFVYTEKFKPNGSGAHDEDFRAVRDARWKLTVTVDAGAESERFFDLGGREIEGPNLLRDGQLGPVQAEARQRLRAEYDRLMADFGVASRPGLPVRAPIP